MPPKARPIDEARALALFDQGHTWQEVADALGVPRTTLISRLRNRGPLPQRTDEASPVVPPSPTPETHNGVPDAAEPGTPEVCAGVQETTTPSVHTGILEVHTGVLEDMLDDLRAMVAWWRERQAALQARGKDSKTQRITFHVEPLWIEMIRRQADLDGRTITEVVNEAFRAYFEREYP